MERRNVVVLLVTVLLATLISLMGLLGCGQKTSSSLDQGLQLYRENKLEQALPFLEQAVQEAGQNADVHAWLAETYRRLKQRDRAIASSRRALAIDPCHTFANTVLAATHNPIYGAWEGASLDTTWQYLLRAVECDSTDGNVWLEIWTHAIRRDDEALEKKALRLMYETDFFAPALLAYNRWALRHLPKNALLLTNGDMDTYPAVALQEVEGYRGDVAVVNRSLLNIPWYARYVRERYGIPLPFEEDELDDLRAFRDQDDNLVTVSDQIIRGWMEQRKGNAFPRPITVSVTVGGLNYAAGDEDHLVLAGPFFSWLPAPAERKEDMAILGACLEGINSEDFSGSLVSLQDRSPVRAVGTDRLVENVTAAALIYSQRLIESDRNREALEMLEWAGKFENRTQRGAVFTERIAELKEKSGHAGM